MFISTIFANAVSSYCSAGESLLRVYVDTSWLRLICPSSTSSASLSYGFGPSGKAPLWLYHYYHDKLLRNSVSRLAPHFSQPEVKETSITQTRRSSVGFVLEILLFYRYDFSVIPVLVALLNWASEKKTDDPRRPFCITAADSP